MRGCVAAVGPGIAAAVEPESDAVDAPQPGRADMRTERSRRLELVGRGARDRIGLALAQALPDRARGGFALVREQVAAVHEGPIALLSLACRADLGALIVVGRQPL